MQLRSPLALGLAACLCALPATLLAPRPAAADEVIDGVAAQVGNDIVLVSEVTQYTEPVERQIREAGAGDDDVLLRGVVDQWRSRFGRVGKRCSAGQQERG